MQTTRNNRWLNLQFSLNFTPYNIDISFIGGHRLQRDHYWLVWAFTLSLLPDFYMNFPRERPCEDLPSYKYSMKIACRKSRLCCNTICYQKSNLQTTSTAYIIQYTYTDTRSVSLHPFSLSNSSSWISIQVLVTDSKKQTVKKDNHISFFTVNEILVSKKD